MPQRTNPFQNLSASIMAVIHAPDYLVEESVLEINPKTGLPREIDIRITEVKNPNNKIMVECRDWKRKQDVIWIDQLDGKARSLRINKVIAISSSGFHKTTLKEAQSKGIETMHLKEAEGNDITDWLFRINKFGLNIDFQPIVTKVEFQGLPGTKSPSFDGVSPRDLCIVNLNERKKISLHDYVVGLIKDPKIIEHIRTNNTGNAINHYQKEISCDPGVGYILNGNKFIQLTKIIFYFDSVQRSQEIPIKHIKAGLHKIMVGEIDSNNRLILEERKGSLAVMIEKRIQNQTEPHQLRDQKRS